MNIQVLVFISEIKFDLTPKKKKIKFSVSFMLLFTIIKLPPALFDSHVRNQFF